MPTPINKKQVEERWQRTRENLGTVVADLYWLSDALPEHRTSIMRLIDEIEDSRAARIPHINEKIKALKD